MHQANEYRMFGNVLLGLTTLSYLALCIFVLQRINTSGESIAGWGVLAFGLTAIYAVLSLVLTISVASIGGFEWLSADARVKNVGIAVLWIGLVVGVSYCTLRMEWQLEPAKGMLRWLMTPLYFGTIWLPLLMLLPYAILLNPTWREALSPNLYKIPLIAGASLGFLIAMAPTIIVKMQYSANYKYQSEAELAFDHSMDIINIETTGKGLLSFTHEEQDQRLRNVAISKIKLRANWEQELVEILEQKNAYDDYWVYTFLEGTALDHPEKLGAPINSSISTITAKIKEAMQDPYMDNLHYLDVETLCRVLTQRFPNEHQVFRSNLLLLQSVLEQQPTKRNGQIDHHKFAEILRSYHQTVTTLLTQNTSDWK